MIEFPYTITNLTTELAPQCAALEIITDTGDFEITYTDKFAEARS